MKANLVKKEPETIERWEKEGLYRKIREVSQGREKYILHDGPPYANGNIHMGHALNKILKDIIIRSKQMTGFDAPYVPGWDCHGLPIEHKVDMELGAKKKDLTQVERRRSCREYAQRYVDIQREEFKRLGILGEWDNPYLTMTYSYEAAIVREFGKFALNGSLNQSKKPVYWCTSCQTALAEAEVEYEQHSSPSIYVKFPMMSDISQALPSLKGKNVSIVIWTTTPWTIPANLAVAMHPDFDYVAIESGDDVLIMAEGLSDSCMNSFGLSGYNVLERFKASSIVNLKARHPLYDRESIIVLAPYVTMDAGTGCVHTAPGHGREDYETGLANNLEAYSPVDGAGHFTKEVEFFAGQEVFSANPSVIQKLKEVGALIKEQKITHEYPHCWRCKKPVIFRSTKQWFISMDNTGLRKKALEAIKNVSWIPTWGEERISLMIANRPDWCISRQRAWGVPITVFFCKECDEIIISKEIIDHVSAMVEKSGADIWFSEKEENLIPSGTTCPKCGKRNFRKETDILDVWFDAGVSYAAVLEKRDYLQTPADLYLEGSDQHRGWFHSSLLCSIGTRGRAPYKKVLTHGFVVDGAGKAMHKSAGNVISPEDMIKDYGAEILRLWVACEDYRDNIRLSKEILQRLTEAYRRIRNTCRYLLGNLNDFNPLTDKIDYDMMDDLDKWALHRLHEVNEKIRRAYDTFEFHSIYHTLHNFCVIDLSSFYLDIIKDRLYAFSKNSVQRRSAQTVMDEILNVLVRLMAPILTFTADEIWQYMGANITSPNVHADLFIPVKKEYINPDLAKKWDDFLKIRKEVTKALEIARKDKLIGHSLDASVMLGVLPEHERLLLPYADDLRTLFIVSSVRMMPADKLEGGMEGEDVKGLRVKVSMCEDTKCERCWIHDPSVGKDGSHPTLCKRCIDALKEME